MPRATVRIALGSILLPAALWATVPAAETGFNAFYNLEYDAAVAAFRQEIAQQPQEADGYNHLAQTILYRALYRSGILENSLVSGNDFLLSLVRQPRLSLSAREEAEFQGAADEAARLARQRLQANARDARAQYALGVTYGLRANYDFLVKKAWISALRESTEARKIHNRLAAQEPGMADAQLMQGVQEYVVASLPGALRRLGAAAGIRGNKERGLRTLEDVAARGASSRVEAAMLLSTVYRHERRHADALSLLARLRADYPRNYLLHFAEIYTHVEARDEHAAEASLRTMARMQTEGAPGYRRVQPEKIDYTGGVLLCRFGHLEPALATMHRLAAGPADLDAQTRLLATERLGMLHDVRGERDLARQAYRQVVHAAPGTSLARESQKYLDRPFQGCQQGD
jgi:hypothetical protein